MKQSKQESNDGSNDKNPNPTRKGRLVRMSEIEEREVEWLWKPYIPLKKIALFRGDPGIGKTFLALMVAAIVSNGDSFPDKLAEGVYMDANSDETVKDKISGMDTQMVTMAQTSAESQQTLDEVNGKVGNESDASTKSTLFGRVKQVLDHLTTNLPTTRANKIDNLDGTVSSRASQTSVNTLQTTANTINTNVGTANTNINTANTNIGASGNTASASGTTLFSLIKFLTGTWTAALVTTTGTINTNVSAIKTNTDKLATGTATVSAVKSVQRGRVTIAADITSATITLSSINANKAAVTLNGCGNLTNPSTRLPHVYSLTSTSLVIGSACPNGSTTVSWEVVDYY